jgi:hypothetical protein
MCPVTGRPDFAEIRIDYIPGKLCIESKSLKFYLASFRNTRSFNNVQSEPSPQPVVIDGVEYFPAIALAESLGVSRQTLWRWRTRKS